MRRVALQAQRRLWRDFRKQSPSSETLHRDRIRIKRIRYARAAWLGREDPDLTRLQGLLGEIRDAELQRERKLAELRKRKR